jgi:hypothetical protein
MSELLHTVGEKKKYVYLIMPFIDVSILKLGLCRSRVSTSNVDLEAVKPRERANSR